MRVTRRILPLIIAICVFLVPFGTAFAGDAQTDGAQILDEAAAIIPEDAPIEPDSGSEVSEPSPTGLYAKILPGNQNVVQFGWKSGGQDDIVVFRATDPEGDWEDVAGIKQSDYGDNSYYLDENVTSGETYYYQLCYYTLEGERTFTGAVSVTVPAGVDPDLPIPSGLYAKMRAGSSNVVEIGWQNMGFDADVYRATSANGPYTLYTFNLQWDTIDEFEDPRLLDKTVQPGVTYYYKVCSIIYWDDDDSDVTRGEFSAPVSIKVPDASAVTVPKPTGLNAQMSYLSPGEVWINWDAADGVDGYLVYKKLDSDSEYTLMQDLKSAYSTSAWDTKALAGKTYQYKVCAYATVSGVTKKSEMAGPVSVKVPGAPSASVGRVTGVAAKSASYNSIKLTWNRTSGADGYYIYRKNSANGSFSALKKLTSGGTLSYTDKSLTSNKVYYYKIVAYKNSGSTIIKGTSSVTVKGRPVVSAVTGLKASSWGKRVVLTWKKSSGASGYIVQWARSRNGTYMNLKILGNTSTYTDYELEYGVVYYYRVVPYRVVSGTRVLGSPSAVVYGGYYDY